MSPEAEASTYEVTGQEYTRDTSFPMAPRDATGRVIRTGDVVKVLGVPDLSRMSRRAHRASRRVFTHIIGTYKRVAGFNEIGWVELSFRILHGPDAGLHTVWIEPELLRVRCARR